MKVTIQKQSMGYDVSWNNQETSSFKGFFDLSRALQQSASLLDASIESVEVKRKQAEPEEVELTPGMVLESLTGRRCVLYHDSGDAVMSYMLIPLDMDLRETDEVDQNWCHRNEIQDLLASGWKLLPGRMEYVEPGDKPALADDNPMPVIEPGMWVESISGNRGGVSHAARNTVFYWHSGSQLRVMELACVGVIKDRLDLVIWQRRPS